MGNKIEIKLGGSSITNQNYDFQVNITTVDFSSPFNAEMVRIVYQCNSVHSINITAEEAVRIGFINPEAIRKYIESDFNN